MRILCIGDVVGSAGCEFLLSELPKLRRFYNADFTAVNGENSNNQNGITPKSADIIFSAGADVITTGNHVFKKREIYDYLDENPYILRPANYPDSTPGRGFCTVDKGRYDVCVINLMGVVFMENLANPFRYIDSLLNGIKAKVVLVDFHAEATSEKIALASYIDGRVSAVVGTHTHVQTADERLLPKGTAFITDLGMTGPKNSSLGLCIEPIIQKFINYMPVRYSVADGACILCGVCIEIDEKTGKALSIERIQIE
ncbi:MAG: TIGR00282 family metallophosphoesterase [Oscillospiraceae bacterium]|jgi:metallophosphoesterase (TIGR00282 family)|nr:TIGR00282 family metallophosphoesterase [Oscillospiraceae bacterium]